MFHVKYLPPLFILIHFTKYILYINIYNVLNVFYLIKHYIKNIFLLLY